VIGQRDALGPFIARLNDAGIRVSLFIAADPAQIEMAAKLKSPVIEIHVGAWCDAVMEGQKQKPTPNGSASSPAPSLRSPPGLKFMPGMASIM